MPRSTVVRPEEIRRHNLSQVLQQIHRRGELTRAELTTSLGLNRSTIGDLVGDLVRQGVVDEHVPGGGEKAGRPSHVVAPRPDGPYVLAVEVEVERIVSAAVGLGGRVHVRHETVVAEPGPAAVVTQIARDARRLAARMPASATLVGVGVSVPGTIQRADGLVVHAPNLRWRNVPFGARLRTRLGADLDVRIGNNANLGALAEHQRGAARAMRDVVYIVGSVGVGGGVIVDGAEMYGAGGYAGEIGHIMLNPDGPECHCGSNGCVETYLGEHALLREAGVADDAFGPAAVAGVLADAERGVPPAADAVATVATSLGRTLAILINVFNPEAIVVGDTLAEILRIERPRVEREVERRAMAAARGCTALLTPDLGRDSSLIGASELAFQALFAT
ncbi:ROK family transcriptional regulator [Cryptosporangium aurantiacum]|uniref:Sugar kinase of the NBD/HSP70 family, may contain an N-terminal HTH domain n=1 Tax=Cryptosporangium aurantiacum TaxID=134849 RepID=A0A1M7JVE4_9ACTN|nr:ROK family transcriptional regulator [Cryptosporangium aurantiacum]SHM57070.1 Sugar kinase of the NBD/HSP70 family, may contain an N-terminal HTH domain [Cryptosporangium aurantiacum]